MRVLEESEVEPVYVRTYSRELHEGWEGGEEEAASVKMVILRLVQEVGYLLPVLPTRHSAPVPHFAQQTRITGQSRRGRGRGRRGRGKGGRGGGRSKRKQGNHW